MLRGELEGRFDAGFYSLDFRVSKRELFTILGLNAKYILHPPEYPREFSETGYQLIRSQNVRPLGLSLEEKPVYFSEEFLKDKKVVYPQKGDVLVVRSGVNAGDVAVVEDNLQKVVIGADTLLIRCRENILPKFLQVYFHTDLGKKQISRHTTGATNKHLNSENLAKVLIPKVSIEQQSIAISQYENALIAKRAKEAEAARLLASIDGYLLEQLGITLPEVTEKKKTFFVSSDKVSGGRLDPFYHRIELYEFDKATSQSKYNLKKIGSLSYEVRGVTYSSNDETLEGKKVLRANNINLRTNTLDWSDIRHVREDIEFSKNQLLQRNDIFMCAASGSKEHAGKVAFIEYDMDFYFGGFMMVVRVQNSVEVFPKYLFEVFASSIFRNHLTRILGGTNINNLNFSMFKNFEIPLPPFEIQKETAAHITEIRTQAQQLEAEAKAAVEAAKKEVEAMILGEGGSGV